MRLYSLADATAVDDGDKHYTAGRDGGFDFPDDLAGRLHGFAVGGRKLWETDIERQHRVVAEEIERRKDPATLLDAVQKLVTAAESMPAGQSAKPSPRRASAGK